MTISALSRCAPLAAACLLAASCSQEAEAPAPAEDNADARGDVLGGSISDAMLPLDTLTSQSPPMASAAGDSETEDTRQEPEDPVETAPVEEPPTAPAATAAPAPASGNESQADGEDPPADGSLR